MPTIIEQPGPTVRQLSGKDPQGRFVLAVVVKQTYTVTPAGVCKVADEQAPLRDKSDIADEKTGFVKHDFELFHWKVKTDVIVKGHVHGYDKKPTQGEAIIQVGATQKRIVVFGDRHCTLGNGSRVYLSNPLPFEKIPLAYTHAYGGADLIAQAAAAPAYLEKTKDIDPAQRDLALAILHRYPRNPCGRGYLFKATPPAIEKLQLPNLEDPAALLTADKLEVQASENWYRMPLPQATDWVAYSWFPRCVGVGIIPPFDRERASFAEVAKGQLTDSQIKLRKPTDADAFLLTNGAPLDLQLPYLRGGESVSLTNLHPKSPVFNFKLPSAPIKICTDARQGKLNETQPVLNSMVIEPDEGRLTLIWRGAAPALRPYMAEELQKMPLRVEI
jgi:hypothetical protein